MGDIPVTYVLVPDEGHGFARPVNNIAQGIDRTSEAWRRVRTGLKEALEAK